MIFEAYPMRSVGRVLMMHQRCSYAVRGTLLVAERHVHDLGRHSRVAEIQVEEGQSLPPLHDCVLLKAGPGFWSMTGFERIEGANGRITDYVQTWVLCPVDELS